MPFKDKIRLMIEEQLIEETLWRRFLKTNKKESKFYNSKLVRLASYDK